ncbi:MAG: hypothetical protein CMJ49_02780, partial [Planctomycetaceae bacterium]|nr:hypothetical protein [Planctomycetaceae bacterium]
NVLIGSHLDDTIGNNVGQAHLFDATTGNLLQTYDDPTPTAGINFGVSVAIDGDNVLIGNGLDSTQGMFVGQAHLFDTAGNLIQTFDDPTVTTQDYFGLSVAIDADHLLIGAPRDDTVNADVGQAHLYVLSILGDINRDGVVDVGDLALVGNQWGTDGSGHPLAWKADIAPVPNGDGVVDIGDMAIVGFNWTSSGGPSLAGAAAVPTPAALPVGILCLLGLSRRRH